LEIAALKSWLRERGEANVLRPASHEDLEQLAQLGVPAVVREFFALAEPGKLIESEGVFLVPIAQLVDANQNVVPGVAASRYGYVVIAKTVSGDAYCVDTNQPDGEGQPPIYIVNHERVSEAATQAEVQQQSRLVSKTFREFLGRFVAETLPYDYYQAEAV
jgi:hypothetical protein